VVALASPIYPTNIDFHFQYTVDDGNTQTDNTLKRAQHWGEMRLSEELQRLGGLRERRFATAYNNTLVEGNVCARLAFSKYRKIHSNI
jgi:hypothetical protein